ncbi:MULTISPECIES: hypothetical protein [unclassified Moraxella]|uniref:hypothetical protein n=1 Tax=unclassified Moraxella TaxID=2685852 RepID=UPI00359F00AE
MIDMNISQSSTSQAQPIRPLWVLVIVLMVVVVHMFVIVVVLSNKNVIRSIMDTKPTISVLKAQILSNNQAVQINQRHATSHQQKTTHHHKDRQSRLRSSPPKMANTWQNPQKIDNKIATEHDDIHKEMNTATFDDAQLFDGTQDDTAQHNQTTHINQPPSGQDAKQASIQATARMIQAWERYANIGDQQIKLTIHLDEVGNVTQVKVVGDDQALASNAIAAIYDAAPFSEVAGLTKTMTVILGAVGMP